jgi:HEPN domain-containing protein
MKVTESQYPSDWFRIASEDLQRAERRLAEGDTDDAAFRLQQAIEKFLNH